MARSAKIFLSVIAITVFIGFLFYAESHFNDYTLRVINLIAINAILAISLNLIYGFTGMFSLGHAGFMAIGAYVCAILLLSPEQKEMMWILEPIAEPLQNLQLPFFPAVLIGGLCAAVIGLLITLPVLRLGGDYLGIATLGFSEIIRVVITNTTSLTNGALGIKGIPQKATLWWNYGWLAFTIIFVALLLRSNTGNVLRAIRDDEIAAKTMGINAFFYRSFSFTVGAFFAGIGGALMASLISTIDPKMFNFLLTFNILMIVVAGGLGSITGSVVGSVVITVMLEWLRIIENPLNFGFINIPGIPGLRMVVFSLLLLAIILFWRKGLLGQHEFSWNGIYCFLTRKKPSNSKKNHE
ncbi:branched-chain amino acid transport system permease protein [Bartonella australis AUST/NH1]|uniref:Branched-chain amino acid transport system permease protein n=1 Tax=Bartonella australis (strain Aust/NH1) TaxID=1094489 RepID=M1PD47_BARAA|nr:branched-chain amino acid ABC transporter permease [Bartonella australis]AGF74506.1 branched-chain amino acid transport system permease protein [Bartonella australis AUST/NH1]